MGAVTEKVSTDILLALVATGISRAELPSHLGIASRSTSDRWFRDGEFSVPHGQLAAKIYKERTGKTRKLEYIKPSTKPAKAAKKRTRVKEVMEIGQEKIAEQQQPEKEFVGLIKYRQEIKEVLFETLDLLGVKYSSLTEL